MMRFLVRLSCDHGLLTDEIPPRDEALYCPGCQLYWGIVSVEPYRDDDLMEYQP